MCNRHAFHHHWKSHYPKRWHRRAGKFEKWARARGFSGRIYPPVNVQELDDRYELFLYAPELTKEDFNISLTDRILTIEVEEKEAATPENSRWRRKEFSPGGFRRQFDLNEKIDTESIEAEYADGVLKVTLSKLEGFETVRQDIQVV